MSKRGQTFEVDGIRVEIGEPMSTDGGVVFVARAVRRSGWFAPLVAALREAVAGIEGDRYGFAAEDKLSRAVLALVCGLAMGYRSGKELAEVIAADRLWREVLGKRVTQPDISRLVDLLSRVGVEALRGALLASASAGLDGLHLDGDSSLLELHGRQEGGAWNGHYQEFGYHAGWMIESTSGRMAALWLNEGNAHTATGQVDVLERMLAGGVRVASYRGDAGMPSPALMALLDTRGASYAMRLRSNAKLDEAAQSICPEGPWRPDTVAFGEVRYGAKSWAGDRRVVVKFQAPESKDGAACLFLESFYFVTNRQDPAKDVVDHYLKRGEAERCFGEFVSAFEPTFRHPDMAKNEVWLQFLGLAHNTLVDLRAQLPEKPEPRRVPTLKPLAGDPGWMSALFHTVVVAPVRTGLARFRAFALKVATRAVSHAGARLQRIHPTHARPGWPRILATA